MKVEKIDLVALDVIDIGKAAKLLGEIFETEFDNLEELLREKNAKSNQTVTGYANREFEKAPIKLYLSPIGIELIETIPPLEREGIRTIAFKVENLEEAKEEMAKKGIRLLKEITAGSFKEAIYHPDDLFGMRLALFEYRTETIKGAYLK
ncbi:VOC family protein [Chloroflexota bacterium]